MTNVSRAFWRADVTKEPLQRVYGITFPDKAQLKEYQRREWSQEATAGALLLPCTHAGQQQQQQAVRHDWLMSAGASCRV